MQTADRKDTLEQVLAALAALAPATDQQRLAGLEERLRSGRLRVLVAGEAKRGKSTVVNALLGRDVLPCGVTPVTAITTTVVYGSDEHVAVEFTGMRAERRPLADLAELVTERGNPGNRRGVSRVTAHVAAALLAQGVEIVDTPGTGSVYEHNTAEAHRALDTLDAAIVVLTVDPPVSAAERELLHNITEHAVATFVLLNKADRLDADERAEALAFTTEVVGAAAGAAGAGMPVYPVCARAALPGGRGDDGFARFAGAFGDYLDRQRAAHVEQAVAGHARRTAQRLLDEVRLAQRMSQMRTGEAADRAGLFRERLAAVGMRRQDAADLVAGEQRRALGALNQAAEQENGRLVAETRAALTALLDGELAGADPGVIDERGHTWLAHRAREGADAWREQQRMRLEESLAELDARLVAGLARELGEIRDAARDLLDLDLAVPDTGERLVASRRFFYAGTEISGQTELLAGAVRRRLPGEFGRRRARDHLLAQVADLAPKLVGRARSDLQYRLSESTRRLARGIDERYAGTIGRLASVADSAMADSSQTGADEQARLRALASREDLLHGLLARLRVEPAAAPAHAARAGRQTAPSR